MKRKNTWSLLVFIVFGLALQSCEEKEDDVPARERERSGTGTWAIGAGYNHPQSFRNNHYTFSVNEDNSMVDITLESSDTEVALWLYNPLGQLVDQEYGDRSENILVDNLSPGKYTVIAGTYQRGEAGNFTLKMKGSDTDLTPISSETLTAAKGWETTGGGYIYPESLRNHHYTFEVTEDNSAVDVVLESDDVEVALWLYNPLGQRINHKLHNRSQYFVEEVDKGVYTVIAGTRERNVQQADYRLNVNGKVTNIQQKNSQNTTASGIITNGARFFDVGSPYNDIYTLEVTENNTALDIIMESPDFDVAFWLLDRNGSIVSRGFGNRRDFSVKDVSAGTYKVVCGVFRSGATGNYQVSVVGKFKNFAKQ